MLCQEYPEPWDDWAKGVVGNFLLLVVIITNTIISKLLLLQWDEPFPFNDTMPKISSNCQIQDMGNVNKNWMDSKQGASMLTKAQEIRKVITTRRSFGVKIQGLLPNQIPITNSNRNLKFEIAISICNWHFICKWCTVYATC